MVGGAHPIGLCDGSLRLWAAPPYSSNGGRRLLYNTLMVGGAHPIELGSEREALSHCFGFALVLDFDADFTAGAERARPG